MLLRVAKDVTSSLRSLHERYDFNAKIFDVIANENACYKHNELEFSITCRKSENTRSLSPNSF